jgi:hypothetical protein
MDHIQATLPVCAVEKPAPVAAPKRRRLALHWLAAILVVTAMAGIGIVHRPMTDPKVFMAAARQADFHGPFPWNVYAAWELKPLGHRILWRALYRSATSIAPYENKRLFEPVFRLLYSLLAGGILLLTVRLARDRLTNCGISQPTAFAFLGLAFFGMNNWHLMQAEHSALLLAMPATALALRAETGARFAAGVLLALAVTLKAITGLIAVQVVLLLLALRPNARPSLAPSLAGAAAGMCAIILLALLVFPQELRDLRNAAIWQGSSGGSWVMDAYGKLSGFLTSTSNGLAVVKLGIAALCVLLLFRIPIGHRAGLCLAACWAIGLAGALIQRMDLAYHFLLLWIPAAVSLALYAHWATSTGPATASRRSALLFGGIAIMLSIGAQPFNWFLPLVPAAWTAWNTVCSSRAGSLSAACTLLAASALAGYQVGRVPESLFSASPKHDVPPMWVQDHQLDRESSLLYLENGPAAYALGVHSWSRYFFPLPVQRAVQSADLGSTPVYRETLSHMREYDGRYILHRYRWFPLERVPELNRMVRDMYHVVEHDTAIGLKLYERRSRKQVQH